MAIIDVVISLIDGFATTHVAPTCCVSRYREEIWGPNAVQRGYEGRSDLGNNQAGDGSRYRGAGYIQITGRYNYQAFANYVGDSQVMGGYTYVASNYAARSATYWYVD